MTEDEILIDRTRLLVKRRKGTAEWKMLGGIAYARTPPPKGTGEKGAKAGA